jgi:hypothetical protein
MPHPVLRVSSTVRIPNPARRLGQIAPLAVRWREAVERVRYELPADHPLQSGGNGLMSELALDDLLDALEAAKAQLAPPPDSPVIRAARAEFSQFQREFNSCAITIKQAQPWLQRAVTDWRHQLLGDITPDCFTVPQRLDFSTEFRSVSEAREAVQALTPRLQWARGICAQIAAAQEFEKRPDEQASVLIEALMSRKIDSDNHIIALSGQVSALEARLGRLEKRKRNKRSKPLARAA